MTTSEQVVSPRGPNDLPEPRYDVFLSFAGTDRSIGRRLADNLSTSGVRVFFDEKIELFSGITESIREALSESKTLLAYYSTDYSERAACQHELMLAILAGEQEGDPCGRIMVLNPEPDTDHLRPVQLADAKFAIADDDELVRAIAKRAAAVGTPIGSALPDSPPSWHAQRVGPVRRFLGRYRELWDLHTALHVAEFPLIDETACGAFAAVSGLPGAGKTALVTTYAWRFAAAYPGGVRWLSLKGATAEPGELRRRLETALIDLDPPRPRLLGRTGVVRTRRSARASPRCLWVVDDIPAGVGPELLEALPLPEFGRTRVILISEDDEFRDDLPVVRVGPLPPGDAAALLDAYRVPDDDEDSNARDELAAHLGHHAASLVTVGKHLCDRHGLASYRTFADDLAITGSVAGAILAPARGVLDRMTPDERLIVLLADRLSTTTFSAASVTGLNDLAPFDVGATLKLLRDRSAAVRVGTDWHLDPNVVRAARKAPPLGAN
ncbi:TIR domain-containing protein [Amycolatopsis sp. NPDC051758]|uniref:tetratricopeptide repeat protein n=1 Tax=Amycolatopsis sp. NPDC051758 TaxID=3363935 RepID=UPI0037A230FA